jgi:hypothetical protein
LARVKITGVTKNAGIEGIYRYVLILMLFSPIMISACMALFKRRI